MAEFHRAGAAIRTRFTPSLRPPVGTFSRVNDSNYGLELLMLDKIFAVYERRLLFLNFQQFSIPFLPATKVCIFTVDAL
jgi:hypothetical protein